MLLRAHIPYDWCDRTPTAHGRAEAQPLQAVLGLVSDRFDAGDRARRPAEGEDMAVTGPSINETRWEQVFPILDVTEIQRLHRFGEARRYEAGEARANTSRPLFNVALQRSSLNKNLPLKPFRKSIDVA
jgi:hypothetical protein